MMGVSTRMRFKQMMIMLEQKEAGDEDISTNMGS
jgi:hypothetical protein